MVRRRKERKRRRGWVLLCLELGKPSFFDALSSRQDLKRKLRLSSFLRSSSETMG